MNGASKGSMFRINFLLVVLGAVAGALAAVPITWFGKIIAGAPAPATLANYLWNMRVFAVMGAIFAPILAWSSLRSVPLWRAALEPTLGGLLGALLGMVLVTITGSEALMIWLSAAGLAAGTWRVSRAHANTQLNSGKASADQLLS